MNKEALCEIIETAKNTIAECDNVIANEEHKKLVAQIRIEVANEWIAKTETTVDI